MSIRPRAYQSRDIRFVPHTPLAILMNGVSLGWIENISNRGVLIASEDPAIRSGEVLANISALCDSENVGLPNAKVVRVSRQEAYTTRPKLTHVACRFVDSPHDALQKIGAQLGPERYVTQELLAEIGSPESEPPRERDLREFAQAKNSRILSKCEDFHEYMKSLQATGLYQSMYRVTLTTPLDHQVTIYNPSRRREEAFVCFDSNSYLGLHVHPRVVETTQVALKEFGYGTPSAQLLSGTSRHMRELEETISAFHSRDATIVFSSGYATNVGAITALVGRHDLAIADQYSHTSIHDACRWANPRQLRTFPHKNSSALDDILTRAIDSKPDVGRLVISDGVFSMHGSVADLPSLSAVAKKHGAALMIDEAHSTGVLGKTGRGIEEHYDAHGSVDVLMGTFSKAPGTAGGYVTGSEELVTYLQFFANSAIFSAALPSALCAGINEAYKIMADDPEPRVTLWENINWLAPALTNIGLTISQVESPILTVFIGDTSLLWQVSRDLYDLGIKCGNVCYPAVPPREGILRISLNARHTRDDLQKCVDALETIGRKYGILGRTREEIQEIGASFALRATNVVSL